MNVLLLGASGMVGLGVLRECLAAADVTEIISLVRSPSGLRHPKLQELALANFRGLGVLEASLRNLGACFYGAGVSSFRMTEADSSAVTHDLTLEVAGTLCRWNPGLALIYLSGAGTDSTERGRAMWARVKGRTENALLALPCRTYMLRPGIIRPVDGITSKTAAYRLIYGFLSPLTPLLEWALPGLSPAPARSDAQCSSSRASARRHGYSRRAIATHCSPRAVDLPAADRAPICHAR